MKTSYYKIKKLEKLLLETPPNLDVASVVLEKWGLPSESLSAVGYAIVEKCAYYYDISNELPALYLYDILALLLKYGMNPNDIHHTKYEEQNIMDLLRHVKFDDVAAKCMRLMLDNGGDPNLLIGGVELFIHIDYFVHFDIVEGIYDGPKDFNIQPIIQCWLLMLAYGISLGEGIIPISMTDGYNYEIFKEYERYRWDVRFYEPRSPEYGFYSVHFFDTVINKEVAILSQKHR